MWAEGTGGGEEESPWASAGGGGACLLSWLSVPRVPSGQGPRASNTLPVSSGDTVSQSTWPRETQVHRQS